ncbi:hypothetical protein DKM19_02005 [Streptosporangium sp. 'caverna']|nr:hypothetical protein DKM19_02005 [Streptosporangium sp. 'caverna']
MCNPGNQADLAKRTGLSVATVSVAARGMIKEGIITETTKRELRINKAATGVAVGVSVGLRQVTVASRLVHEAPNQTRFRRIDLGVSGGDEWMTETANAIHEIVGKIGEHRSDIVTIGMGVPWSVDPRTLMPGGPAPPWADSRPIGKLVAEKLTHPPDDEIKVVVETDARVAALYEQTYNYPYETLLFVQISAHVLGGQLQGPLLHKGADGSATNVGHLKADFAGKDCWCGERGCLERYVNSSILLEEAFVKCRAQQTEPPMSIEQLIARAEAHDPICLEVLRSAAAQLSRVLIEASKMAKTHAIVIGGTVAPGLALVLNRGNRDLDRSEWTRKIRLHFGDVDSSAQGALLFGLTSHLH